MAGPLDGYRIIDLTAFITGPLATMILGDQGADVIKVEPPGLGDVMRYLGTQRGGMSSLFASCNRSKRSIALNLREEQGREILKGLVTEADVFVQNFRPGVVERLGIHESHLRSIRPELVYVSISAFGPTGPLATRPAFDHIIQGLSGNAALQGDAETGRPAYVRNAICDKVTAYTAAQAITAALLARERGQGGQHLQMSMLDSMIAFLWPDGMGNQTILEEDAILLPPIAESYRFVETADGYLSVAAVTDAQWHGLFRAVDRRDLIGNMTSLLNYLPNVRFDRTTPEALAQLQAEDVPCGPILSLQDVPRHPQVIENGILMETRHPQLGRMREPRPAARFDGTPTQLRRPAPGLGQHGDEVLSEFGLSTAAIQDLRDQGIVA
jgi:crotonobetainyl-CoA:carnitine CoA-transferase CaiB-like acyl-CoA transferase